MDYFPGLLQKIAEIAINPASNLQRALYPIFKDIFSLENECDSSRIYRERAALLLLNFEHLRQPLYNVPDDQVNKVIETFITTCSRNMVYFEDIYGFWVSPLEPLLDRKLLEDSLHVLCRTSPQNHVKTIERIWCFDDDANGMKNFISKKLRSQIENSPIHVLQWIDAFKLYEFKTSNLERLALSCLVKNLDITTFLMTDDSSKDAILSFLDKYITNKRPIPSTTLEAQFFKKYSVSSLSSLLYKWARPNRFEKIPLTIEYRVMENFNYNCAVATSENDKRNLALQTVQASTHSSTQVKKIIKCIIKQGEEVLAMALASFVSLSPQDLLELLPQYNSISSAKRQAVDNDIYEMANLQSKGERISAIKFDGFNCFLVDKQETFNELLATMFNHQNVAFDVEASFVCQSETSSQDAALLQLAFSNHTVFLVDIFVLKKFLDTDDWELFFNRFLCPKVRRIGFDIKNDLIFLQNSFNFLEKWIADKKPLFFCVQEAVKTHNSLDSFFGGKASQLSLQYVTKVLLDVELEKEEQSGNWLIRPLNKKKMKEAAADAFYTLKCFYKIKERLDKNQWLDLKRSIYRVRESKKVVETNKHTVVTKKKETFEEIIAHIQNVSEEIQHFRDAEETLIVLDVPFLRFSGILKRFGFKTWDHRDACSKADKNATQMAKEMESRLKEIPEEKRTLTFILTNKKTLPVWLSAFDKTKIYAEQEQLESVVVEKIVRETHALIDFSLIDRRCSSCAELDTHFLIPMAAYRSIYKSYAKFKKFADNIEGLEDSMETFNDIFNSLSPDLKLNCSIDGEELIVQSNAGIFRFSINGRDRNVSAGKETSSFKCDTRLFENKYDRNEVKFCWKCKIFF